MSFRYAAVAVRASKEALLEAVLEIQDHLTPVEGPITCATGPELTAWTATRIEPPSDVKSAYQDGARAVLVDESQLMIADESILHRLSLRFGVVTAGVAQGSAGGAMFDFYEGGQRFRRIQAAGRRVVTEGAPLPEEEGIDVSVRFHLDELRRLWRALGMTDFRLPATGPFLAVRVIDTEAALNPPRPRPDDKPWWRFW